MRVQNEGTGKSSWWIVCHDTKPMKTPRRRAATMDTKTFDKKRSKLKEKVASLRGTESSLSPHFNFDLNFRSRTSSNASSVARLSPIKAEAEAENEAIHASWNTRSNSPYTSWESFSDNVKEGRVPPDSMEDTQKIYHADQSDKPCHFNFEQCKQFEALSCGERTKDPALQDNSHASVTSSLEKINLVDYNGASMQQGKAQTANKAATYPTADPVEPLKNESDPQRCSALKDWLSNPELWKCLAQRPHLLHKVQQMIRAKRDEKLLQQQQQQQSLVPSIQTLVNSSRADVAPQLLSKSSFEAFPGNFEVGPEDIDVDPGIAHELSYDDILDFNFDQVQNV